MFRRLLIATLIGLLAALAVALFRHAMVVLETLLLSNDSGSLVNAAQSLPAWRRLVTPALGGLTAGTLLWLWQRRSVARPHAATDYMEALETGDGCFDTPASLVKSLASLLVVVTGSAIGREGAMILLAALAASLSRPFVLERFCEQEGGSERALRQQFRQQTGMTINHYLRQLRICHAQYLLQHTERLIGDIAMQCGFEDSNYFSVVFSREIGMSPGQWRQRSRAAA